jgi:hypothetical protein
MRPLMSLTAAIVVVVAGGVIGMPQAGTAAFAPSKARFAQAAPTTTPAEQPAVTSRRTVNLTEEDRHTIREIVLKDTHVSKAPANVNAAIGDPPPQDVVTYEFPPQISEKISALQSLKYFVKADDEIVIVDTKGGKIADIVK